MNSKKNFTIGRTVSAQRGMITTFSAVLILVMLILMMFFAVRVGVVDQQVSANDLRQKMAFHTAESGIQHAKEFFLANSTIAASPEINKIVGNGTDGWLSADGLRWLPCSGVDLTAGSGTHPCFGEPDTDRRDNTYFYSFADTLTTDDLTVPVLTNDVMVGDTETVNVQALLCVLEIDFTQDIPVQGCSTNTSDPSAAGYADGNHYMITLLARGEADCTGGANCNAEAMIREQVSNFGGAAGGQAPSVPLTTKSAFPPSGSAEVVPNPNSGGVGVPVSVWMNANASCGSGSVIDPSSGSWATCEMHEWYGVDALPDDYACPTSNCSCSLSESISNTHGTTDTLGIDLVADPDFPCDLFKFYFGVPRASYEIVKGYAKVLSDCSTLGPNSTGIFWISGAECRINSNTTVGGPKNPVLLVSAATETRFNGGAKVYGVVYISDTEDANAALYSNGTNTVYGQVIVDASMGSYTGTFQVVYNENTISNAAGTGGLGNVIGGWSDFSDTWQ